MGLATTLLRALVLWLLAALALAIVLFIVVRRLGWLDVRPPARTGWSRVLFGLLLFLVFGPASTATGVVFSVRNKVSSIVLEQARRLKVTAALGQLALLPMVAAHGALLLEEKEKLGGRALDALREAGGLEQLLDRDLRKRTRDQLLGRLGRQLSSEADVSFLLDGARNRRAVGLLSQRLVRQSLKGKEGETRASLVGRLVTSLLARYAAGPVDQRLAFYNELMVGLSPGAGGRLTWREAGDQTGERLLSRTLIRAIHRPFDHLMLVLLAVALAPPLLLVGIVRLAALKRLPPKKTGE